MINKLLIILSLAFLMLLVVWENGTADTTRKKAFSEEQPLVTPEVIEEWDAGLNAFINSGGILKRPHKITPSTNIAQLTDTIGTTTYDFGGNSTAGRRIALSKGNTGMGQFDGVHFAYMKRSDGSNANRYATYDFYDRDLGIFFSPNPFLSYGGSGWACVVDGNDHEALMVFHFTPAGNPTVTTRFVKDDGQAAYGFSTDMEVDPDGLWPGLAAWGDTLFITNNPDPARIPGTTFYSTDYGANWTVSGWPAPPTAAALNFENPESWPEFNPANPGEIGFALLQEEEPTPAGTNYQGGVAWATTTDFGATWNETAVYDFGTLLPGNFAYLPQTLFQHTFYTQIMNAYSDNGIGHVVFNGSGFQLDGQDSVSIYPVVYWNTQDQQLIELTADSVARNPAIADTVLSLFPYRCIGNSWPHIATGPDGVIAAVWQQIEMLDSNNITVVFGTNAGSQVPFYATDIFCAVSADYGQTWSDPFKVGGELGECDMTPILARQVEKDDQDNYLMHLMYYWDTNPGGSLASPAETDWSVGAWIYNQVDITSHLIFNAIDDPNDNVISDFQLQQNYPNPFNPTTNIKFSIAKAGHVNIRVFNILGEEVATIVNENKTAGAHSIEFDASRLASGLYFYTMTASNYVETRKMVLLK